MTDIIGNETLRSLWDGLATTQGEKTFLIFQGRQGAVTEFTYKQFNDEINKAANLFLARGIQRDEKVAVQLHTSPEFMMCLFGLAKIGAVMVPMNEQYLQEECEYVLNKCEAT
ncbi:MAG: AMP-binding protein, partial [Raoultibacter sp.]